VESRGRRWPNSCRSTRCVWPRIVFALVSGRVSPCPDAIFTGSVRLEIWYVPKDSWKQLTHGWRSWSITVRCGEQNAVLKLEHHMTPTTIPLRAAKNKAGLSVGIWHGCEQAPGTWQNSATWCHPILEYTATNITMKILQNLNVKARFSVKALDGVWHRGSSALFSIYLNRA